MVTKRSRHHAAAPAARGGRGGDRGGASPLPRGGQGGERHGPGGPLPAMGAGGRGPLEAWTQTLGLGLGLGSNPNPNPNPTPDPN